MVGGNDVQTASPELLRAHGLEPGYMSPLNAGPQDDDFVILVDETVMQIKNGVTGANKHGYHYRYVTPARDFKDVKTATIRLITERDVCPECGGEVKLTQGIEVGQVFGLGTKYSESLNATFLDKDGKAKPFVMGCYGIGVTRTVAATIEQLHDDKGIIWPVATAPFEAVVLPVNMKDEAIVSVAKKLYDELLDLDVDVLLDDRDERAGVKFNDADLIGYPVRLTVGSKAADGKVEVKIRRTDEEEEVTIEEAAEHVVRLLRDLRKKHL